MTRYLLDTNIILFVMEDDPRLTADAREAITLGENAISVVSYWEVTIKTMKGNLDVEDPAKWWDQALCELSASALTIRPEHIKQVFDLPPIHKDPFDRMLIAQAIAEGLTLITTDARLASYASKSFKVIC